MGQSKPKKHKADLRRKKRRRTLTPPSPRASQCSRLCLGKSARENLSISVPLEKVETPECPQRLCLLWQNSECVLRWGGSEGSGRASLSISKTLSPKPHADGRPGNLVPEHPDPDLLLTVGSKLQRAQCVGTRVPSKVQCRPFSPGLFLTLRHLIQGVGAP